MFKVLAVDDEEIICRGIKSKIERMGNPFIQKIMIATSGLEAEEIVLREKPDIIITDIRMPEINGLALIDRVRRKNPQIKFIVLSGYDEFEYAKEAFKTGAMDYLLKPVKVKELSAIIEKAMDEIRKDRQDVLYRQRIALERILNEVVVSTKPAGAVPDEKLHELKKVFSGTYTCASIMHCTRDNIMTVGNREECDRIISDLYDEEITAYGMKLLHFYSLHNELVLFFNYNETSQYSKTMENIKLIRFELEKLQQDEFFCSISEISDRVEDFHMLYCQAGTALNYKILSKNREILEYRNYKNRKDEADITREHLRAFEEDIMNFKAQHVSGFIDDIFEQQNIKNLSIDAIEKLYLKIVKTIQRIIEEEGVGNPAMQSAPSAISSFGSISEIKVYLKEWVFGLMGALKDKLNSKTCVEVAKKYIEENFDKDINMAMVANRISMSYSHFSRQFKKETGMNFFDYLTRVRMNEARKLLSDPTIRVGEIAVKTGYVNYRRFTKAFKNYFKISPNELRQKREYENIKEG